VSGNLIGKIDLYQTTHHGLDRSNSPQFIEVVQPAVIVMNNGPRKGGQPSVFETFRKVRRLQDIWQGHFAMGTPKEVNSDEKMIANLGASADCAGSLLKASVKAVEDKVSVPDLQCDHVAPVGHRSPRRSACGA
jgi:competence protein ComEC